jgi:hypothetical protein
VREARKGPGLTVAAPTDEIYEKYLQKAIREINDLGEEIMRAAGDGAVPVLHSLRAHQHRLPSASKRYRLDVMRGGTESRREGSP